MKPLVAKRHWKVLYLVYVIDESLPKADGQVVAKANLRSGTVWRTNHAGPRRPMGEIRKAAATSTP